MRMRVKNVKMKTMLYFVQHRHTGTNNLEKTCKKLDFVMLILKKVSFN